MDKISHTFVILAYKESKYLKDCINSVLSQTIKSNIVVATSTKNKFIEELAKKNNLTIIENKGEKGIANDFNFAVNCVDSNLVTIAHQDDIYDKDYLKNILKFYKKYPKSTLFFTDYYEIRDNKKIYNNKNLKIKKILLLPLRVRFLSGFKMIKRSSLSFGNAICCPSVTFNKNNIKMTDIFSSSFTSNMDWLAWERISKIKGNFIYISKPLMGHRVHEESTTTKIINAGQRSDEDYEMFKLFWPKYIAKILTKIYKNSEKSNDIDR